MNRGVKRIVLFFLFFAGLIFNVSGQSNNKISGVVIDANTKEPLPGASIMLDNSSKGTVTDLNGRYILDGIKENKVSVTVSYISYESISKEFTFSGGIRHVTYNPELESVTTDIEEANVVGQAKGEIKAQLLELRTTNIINVVSAQQIEQNPDLNAAEVLQRLPGITIQRDQGEGKYVQLRGTPPELTNFSINGEQIPSPEGGERFVGLNVISSDQIESIEVSKVLTPDMDADAVGGNVNIITKTAKEGKPETKISVAGGYNHLSNSFKNAQLSFSQSQRINKLGINLGGSYYVNNFVSHNIEFKYDKLPWRGSTEEGVDNYHLSYDEIQLRHYTITKKRIGLNAALDYKFNENSNIYFRAMYNDFTDDETRRRVIYTLEDPVNFTYYIYGGVDRDLKARIKKQSLSSFNLGGEHDQGIFKIRAELSYSLAQEESPDRLEIRFDNPGQAIHTKIDLEDRNYPKIYFQSAVDSANAQNYNNYEFDELVFTQSHTSDENLTAKTDITIPIKAISNNSYLKFGAKVRYKTKERDNNSSVYGRYYSNTETNQIPSNWHISEFEGGDLSVATVTDGFSEDNLLGKGYLVNYTPGANEVRNYFEQNAHQFRINRVDTKYETFGQDFEANELIQAAYAMFNVEYGKITTVGGIRFSMTEVDYTGRSVMLDSLLRRYERTDTLSDKRTHRFILPMLQVKYSFSDNVNIKASYTQNYTRPKFNDVMPMRVQDRGEVDYGNPNLIFPTAENFDLFAEYFGKRGTQFRGGIFYKNIYDFVYLLRLKAHENLTNKQLSDDDIREILSEHNPSKPRITVPVNGNLATVYGFEFVGQVKFDFISPYLKDFGVKGNYTYTESSAKINQRKAGNEHYGEQIFFYINDIEASIDSENGEEEISLPGQAKHSANAAIFYDGSKFYAKLSMNYQSYFLHALGIEKDYDEYYGSSLHVDFNTHYNISDNLKIFFDAVNITNTPLLYYLGSKDYTQKLEFYSFSARFGLKLKF